MLQSPRSVFAALRDDSDAAAEERQDVAGALVWLAGIAGVLATSVASTLMDDPARDWIVVALWAFLAGGLYGFVLWALALLLVGVRTVHGWSWGRSLAGVAFASGIAAALALAVSVLYAFG